MEQKVLNGGKLLSNLLGLVEGYIKTRYSFQVINILDSPNAVNNPMYKQVIQSILFDIYDSLIDVWSFHKELVDMFVSQGINSDNKPTYEKNLLILNGKVINMFSLYLVMVYALRIGPDDIIDYYDKLLTQRNLKDGLLFKDGLMTTMAYARHNNIYDDQARISGFHSFQIIFDADVRADFKLALAGRKISPELADVIGYDVLNSLSSIRYAYVQYINLSNKERFDEEFMVSWLYMAKLLDLLAVETNSLYYFTEKLLKGELQNN